MSSMPSVSSIAPDNKLKVYLAKLDDPSKIKKYLRKISLMEVTKEIIYECDADLTIKNLTSHATLGFVAQQILNRWSEEVLFCSEPSTPESTPIPCETKPSRKRPARYIMMCDTDTKKYKVDSDYEDTDSEYGRLYDKKIDLLIELNLLEEEIRKEAREKAARAASTSECATTQSALPQTSSAIYIANKTHEVRIKVKVSRKTTAPMMAKMKRLTGRK